MFDRARRTAALFALLAAPLAAACGGDDGGSGPSSSATLVVQNTSPSTILIVNFSACTDATWGPDRLGSSEVIEPGAQRSWTVEPGCYDVRARTTSAAKQWLGYTITSGETELFIADSFELTVVDDGSTAALKAR